MTWEAWLTVAVLAGVVVVLARDLLPPSAAVIGGTVALLVVGVIDADQAFAGFSNPAPITVAALYVLARAVEKTGALQPIVRGTLGEGQRPRVSLIRLLLPTAAASAFLNNTPIVAMLVPQVREWAEKQGHSASRYLMPLSFAAILGGMVTAIGTSTNLVISGLLQESGFEPLAMFEISRVGLPIALIGIVAIVVLAPVVLPSRKPVRQELAEATREFAVSMMVVREGPLDGVPVEAGGLRHLQGVFLVEIERGGEAIAPVGPNTKLQGGDRLIFVGRADLVVDLHRMAGLVSSEQPHLREFETRQLAFFEAVVGANSALVGQTLKGIQFRGRYQGAVVAIHRAGQRVRSKLGTVPLKVGDTLLILADRAFRDRWRDGSDFLLVSRMGGWLPVTSRQAWFVGLIVLTVVVGAGLGLLPILHLSLMAALALVVTGVLTPGEARGSVDLDVILVIAAAFGLGAAVQVSGLAQHIAGFVVTGFGPLGAAGGILGVVLATIALMTVITNNASAVLMFPIGLATAQRLDLDPRMFALGVAIAASTSFLTPIAYQTNLMVYGPGGYRFWDYARLGLPLTVLVVGLLLWLLPGV